MALQVDMSVGAVEPIQVDGALVGVLCTDADLPLGLPTIAVGAYSAGSLAIVVGLPDWATHVEIVHASNLGRSVTLPAGVASIRPEDVGGEAGSGDVPLFVRARAGDVWGLWTFRRLYFRAAPVFPGPVPPLEVIGAPVATTSGVVAAAWSVVWPSTNRVPAAVERLIRVYAAASGGSPVETIAWQDTIPARAGSWIAPVYRAYDASRGAWLEAEGFRTLVLAAASAAIAPGDVVWTTAWTDASRTLMTVQVDVAGVAASDELQWRVATRRITTAWVDCPVVSGARRRLGDVTIPAGQPGAGELLNQFDDDEYRHAIELRKRVSGGDWSATSGKLRADPPSAYLPTTTITAAAGWEAALRAAIIAGFASSGPVVIHLVGPGPFVLADPAASGLDFTGLTKSGRPLVIRSADRVNPPRIRGFQGVLFGFANCENIVLDRLYIHNDRTKPLGGQNGVPILQYPAGYAVRTENCRRIAIKDCRIRYVDNAIGFLTSTSDCYVGGCEFWEMSQDCLRLYGRSTGLLVERIHQHDPLTYTLWAIQDIAPNYHSDSLQGATSGVGGHKGLRIVDSVMLGFDGYYTGLILQNTRVTEDLSRMSTDAYEDILLENLYIEMGHPIGIQLQHARRATIRNCKLTSWQTDDDPTYNRPGGTLQLGGLLEDVLVTGCCVPSVYWMPGLGATVPQSQAGVTFADHVANAGNYALWPTAWPNPGGDRRMVYAPGPDFYRR